MLLAGFLLVAGVPAASADEAVRERNRAWLLEQMPGYDPDAVVEVHEGGDVETMTAEDALALALDRAGDRDLSATVEGASDQETLLVGEVMVLAFGVTDCEPTTLAPQPLSVPVDPQFWLHQGEIGFAHGVQTQSWWAYSTTFKTTATGSGPISYGGVVNDFCFQGDWFGLLFPFVDGYLMDHALPPG